MVWGLIASMYIGNMHSVGDQHRIHSADGLDHGPNPPYIRVVVLILALMGVYSFRNTTLDVVVMLSFAVFGIFLKRYEFPLAPMVLGLILGDRAEISLRQSMTISQNDLSIFFTQPISLCC